MKYSNQEIENHFADIVKLQCFVNAEDTEEINITLNKSVVNWIKKYDFSQIEFTSHLIEFYQIEDKYRNLLAEIINSKGIDDLIEFVTVYGTKEYDSKSDFWTSFLQELKKRGVEVTGIKPSDKIEKLLKNNLSNFVYALSKISSGKIKSFSVSKNYKRRLFGLLLIGLVVAELAAFIFGLYFLLKIMLIPLVIVLLILIYIQRKFPETIQINNYVTFQDMINDIVG